MRHSTTISVRLQALQTQSQASNSCCAPPLPRQCGMEAAGLVLVGQSSLKAVLDRAWGEPTALERTLRVVLEEVER